MRGLLIATYVANLFLSFHYFIPAYMTSSYLARYAGEAGAGLFYSFAALLTLPLLFFSTRLLQRFGNTRLLLFFGTLDAFALLALALSPSPEAVFLGLLGHFVSAPIILFSLDIYLERATASESVTGTVRGTYLTVANATLIASPLLAALLIETSGERLVYGVALLLLLPVLALGASVFRGFNDPSYAEARLGDALAHIRGDRRLRAVFLVNLLLQFFYASMVVYAPLLLRELGLSWTEIGLILSIMLIPFLLFELPVGRLADTRVSERRLVYVGLFLLGFFTLLFGLSAGYSFVWFASVLFMTRVGASFVETAVESYFFKQMKSGNASLVALFRSGRSLSYLAGPLAGTLLLPFVSLQGLFIILGFIMFGGFLAARHMHPL